MKQEQLDIWKTTIRLHHIAHSRCASQFAKKHRYIGVPVVLLTTIVGSSVFASLGDSPSAELIILTGFLSIVAAVFSSLQTFLNYPKLAEDHKIAAANYGSLRREIEHLTNRSIACVEEFDGDLKEFLDKWIEADKNSPSIPQDEHDKAHRQMLESMERENTNVELKTQSAIDIKLERKPTLLLIRGLPGSGKSTLAKSYKNYLHFEADMYFERNGIFLYDREKLEDAHGWCLSCTKKALKEGNSVVVSNTFTRNIEMQPYFELGYPTTVIEATGHWKSIHDVPEEHVEIMRNKWEELDIDLTNEKLKY